MGSCSQGDWVNSMGAKISVQDTQAKSVWPKRCLGEILPTASHGDVHNLRSLPHEMTIVETASPWPGARAWPGVSQRLDHESTSHHSERWWNGALAHNPRPPLGLRLALRQWWNGVYRLWFQQLSDDSDDPTFGISTQLEISQIMIFRLQPR